MMTYKQIEASREVRLWLGQILIPAAGIMVSLAAMPEVRESIRYKIEEFKSNIQKKFNKK